VTDDAQPTAADDDPPEVRQAGQTARAKLDLLREFCDLPNSADLNPCVLVRVADEAGAADLWLRVVAVDGDSFAAEVGEVPDGFAGAAPGDVLMVPPDDVRDWVVNDDGDLYGGYTLRLQRAALPAEEQPGFDQALGVRKYR
jgi:uncharacterized protein YegJ (DUF2314 family)